MTLKLKAGGAYVSRASGAPVRITRYCMTSRVFVDTNGRAYFENGRKHQVHETPEDLIAEYAEPTDVPDTNPKTRIGLSKPSMRGIPSAALVHLGRVMEDGIRKYGHFNWREHTVSASVYEDAIWRHMLAWRDGEDNAADSDAPHLAHVMACCAILLDAQANGMLNDNRGPKGNAPELIAQFTRKADETASG